MISPNTYKVDSLLLKRNSYYAPVPMITIQSNHKINDVNIAWQLLMGDVLGYYRFIKTEEFMERTKVRVKGQLFPPYVMENTSQLSDQKTSSCEFQTDHFGKASLQVKAICHLDLSNGKDKGTTVYFEIVALEKMDAYRDLFAARTNHQLTWESYAVSYDRILPRLSYYQEVFMRHMNAMSEKNISKVLDLGAGTGNAAVELAENGKCVTAIDLSRAMIEKLRMKSCNLTDNHPIILEQNVECLSQLGDQSFDGITILLALYDMQQPIRALKEAVRLLRPGGTLIITEPKKNFQIDDVLQDCQKDLIKQSVYDELKEDWKRVTTANQVLDPLANPNTPRLFAEDIQEKLHTLGFTDIQLKDSHGGNCATIWGKSPIDTDKKP